MALYSIADLHLSGAVPKSMEIFGNRWVGYTEKLERMWRAIVRPEDTVVIPGDISWGMRLSEAMPDFRFLESLPGRKLLGKGNHDLWWTTVTKMRRALAEAGLVSMDFLYNNAYRVEGKIVCGTRGWFLEERRQIVQSPTDYAALVAREAIRLELCLHAAEELRTDAGEEILVYLHFPPVCGDFCCTEFLEILRAHRIRRCFYGHLHGNYSLPSTVERDGILFRLIAADYLQFTPLLT